MAIDLIPNQTYRVIGSTASLTSIKQGLYRVIVDAPQSDTTVMVLIRPEGDAKPRGGRRQKKKEALRSKRKKAAAVKRHFKRVRSMQLPKKLY